MADKVSVREARPVVDGCIESIRAISTFERANPRMSPRSANARRLNAARSAVVEFKWDLTNRVKMEAAQRVIDLIAKYGVGGLAVRFNG